MRKDITYPDVLREAVKVSRRIGTWFIYALRDEPNLDYTIGYMLGRIDDFSRRRDQAILDKAYYRDRIAFWKRAISFAQRLGDRHVAIAKRIVSDIERDPELKKLPFVAESEVAPGRSDDRSKLAHRPPRGSGKPRVREVTPLDFEACKSCKGAGFFRRTVRNG